jgi:uncharacterized membrane protein YoaK (UPF0700 family)
MTAPGRASLAESGFLAGVGGCIDAIGVLTLGGLFVSHMSGNSAALGAFFGQGHWAAGWPHLLAVPVFLAGLFCGYYWTAGRATPRRCAAILLGEAGLLALFAAGLAALGSVPHPFPLAVLPLFAMGLQNATLREIGRSTFPATYVTGVLDRCAKSAAQWVRTRGTPEGPAAGRDAVAAWGIWLSYVTGALLGSVGLWWARPAVLLIPIAVLVGLAVRFTRLR